MGSEMCIRDRDGSVESGFRAIETEDVLAEISGQEQLVPVAQSVVDFGIEIVEKVAGALERRPFDEGPRQDVEVGAATGQNQAARVLDDRPLDGEPGADEAQSACGFPFFGVALFQSDVEDRAHSSSVLSRHGPFDEVDVFDGVGVEHTEESEQMRGVVHRRIVQ